jgi:two-component sensor histidine kinase
MKYLFSLFLFLLPFISSSQSVGNNYTVKWVNAQDGLKQLSVKYCIADVHGFVWIGTQLGLYRYDGTNLIEIKDEKYPSLSKQRIIAMGKDRLTGKIYLQTHPDNLKYSIDNNKIERIDSNNNWKNVIFTFNDFCYTNSNPLINNICKNTKIRAFTNIYNSFAFLTASLTTNHLYLPQNNNLVAFDKNGLLNNFNIPATSGLVLMQFGEEVLATDKGKVTLLYEGKISTKKIQVDAVFQNYLDRDLMKLSDIEVFGSKKNYFLKYKGGIYKITYRNNSISTTFLFNSPVDDITTISYLEKENLYFIGTHTKGMAILRPNLFNTIVIDERNLNKSINYCYSVVAISNKKWYSASGWNFNPKSLELNLDTFLIDYRNNYFILPYKNKFYIHTKNNFWNIENNKTDYDFIDPKFKKLNLPGFSGYTYHKGQLFISRPNEIIFLKGANFVSDESLNFKIKGKYINGVFSVNDVLLLLTSKGVFNYSPETKKMTIVKGLEKLNARYIKPIDKTSYWVGCYGEGLFLVKNNTVHKVIDANIDITTAHAVEEDAQGNLWISTNDGLLKTEKASSIKKILKNQPLDCYKYSTEDGLLTNEFNGGGTHTSLNTSEGIIGFTSMKGFVWFNPMQVPKHLFKGRIVMDKVIVDNEKIIPVINNTYWIPKETAIVTFNFGYGYYFNRENLTIAYRFEDQPKWTTIKGTAFQIGRYKKGKHQLLIRISTHGFEKKQEVTQSFLLDFEARHNETLWFWSLCTLFFGLFIFSTFRISLKLNKKREDKLKIKIEEKTVELQQSLTELANSNEIVLVSLKEKEILLKEIHHRVKNNLQLVMSLLNIQARDKETISIEDFLEKGHSRIASMVLIHENLYQKENVGKVDFQEYIHSLSENVKATFGEINNTIHIEINAIGIYFDIETAVPLGIIINELITNAMKHAFPNNKNGTIAISITNLDNAAYEVIIEDNGIGTTPQLKTKKSLGLELVSLLVLQLKGTFIHEKNKGTRYRITFDI